MQNQSLAAHVHEVFSRGLDLHERLERGDAADFRVEHEYLRKHLWADGEVAANPEYAGERGGAGAREAGLPPPNAVFLGARYALACWLDEIFILDSPWGNVWNDASLEVEVVGSGTKERAWRFWAQAKRAATRPGTDALEVYLWCVVLGFRGDPAAEGVQVADWVDQTRAHIIRTRNQRFPHDAGSNPRPSVDYLTGRRQFVRMLQVGTLAASAAAFYAAYRILRAQT